MCINDSINILTLYFLDHTTLKFIEIEKLIPQDENQDKDGSLASLIGALNSPQMLQLLETVTPVPNDINSLIYVLKKPLVFNRQTVEISGLLALQIAQVVNTFVDDESDQSNPLQVVELDIQHLLNIINFLSDNESEQEIPINKKKNN